MAVYMGAGPSVMYATHALDAFAQFGTTRAQEVQNPDGWKATQSEALEPIDPSRRRP